MGWVGTAAAVVLAGLLVWAAVAKLADRPATEAGFRAMGLLGADRLAVAVPVTELLIAAALLAAPRIGGVTALVALATLTVVLVAVMRSGRGVPCPCFGAARARPIGRRDIVRNAALMALAVLVILCS
jgi:uncharacterized membrane protein YphA (DoxX/SURF4 family)